MKKLFAKLGEVKGEFLKVVWPSKEEVINSTTLVIVLSVAISIYLGVFDFIFAKGLDRLDALFS